MSTGEESIQGVPAVVEGAPRVTLLTDARGRGGVKIACRRIVTLIGSRQGCKIVLRHGRVSPVHAALINTGTEVLAVDLVTPSGTLFNDLKMEHEALSSGDVLKIGPWSFEIALEPPAREQEGFHPFGLEPAPNVVALEHVATKRILQPTRDVCIIGRRAGCDITISDTAVSRTHAILFRYFGFPAILDLLTRNPTLVNDAPVTFRLLQDDDVVTIGESRFRLRLHGAPGPSKTLPRTNGLPVTSGPTIQPHPGDLIDIKATEGSQRWRIAESLEKATQKR